MGMNESMFSSNTIYWETPQDTFDKYNLIYQFDVDVCALPENAKCSAFYTEEQDGLAQNWAFKTCWMNPPYGREIKHWVQKAYEESRKEGTIVVGLLPSRTDTRWFHDYIYNKEKVQVEFLKGRLKFGAAKNSAPFPSMVVVWGCETWEI